MILFGRLIATVFLGVSSAQAACTAPWGAYIPEGSMIIAYQSSNPPLGQACQSQTRFCHGGLLSGYYTAQSCHADTSCRGPFGPVANGASITTYESDVAYKPQLCKSQVRTCFDGNLSGFYTNMSCSQF